MVGEKPESLLHSIDFLKVFAAIVAVAMIAAFSFAAVNYFESQKIPKFNVKECGNNVVVGANEKCPCAFACCEKSDKNFALKACGEGLECTSHECIPQMEECPTECCNEVQNYIDKPCASGGECIGNECENPVCPFECCQSSKNYPEKDCTVGSECISNSCQAIAQQKPACTFECCSILDVNYSQKDCNAPKHCSSRQCVSPACPFNCCTVSDSNYQSKSCNSGQVCNSSHNCAFSSAADSPSPTPSSKAACSFECCDASDSNYQPKYCILPFTCQNNSCLKPVCPFDCCSGIAEYSDKNCAAGKLCYYSVCGSEFYDCGSSVQCSLTTLASCTKSSSTFSIAGEQYYTEVQGYSTAPNCKLFVKLISSPLRPEKVNSTMLCTVQLSSQQLSQSFFELLIQGQLPQYCQGSLI
ncbi:MAG: hypothetical protein Q7R70_02370 [Candidatus Diapherotrites archaeon]|nr:hypothetical protein [Candidatus Diapherotrites archaeon]